MTNAELKKKISEAPEQEWFKTISVTFSFPITQQLSFTGLSTIYEFVSHQVKGWDTFDSLPNELNQSKTFFTNIEDAVINFVNNYSQQRVDNLNAYWQNQVLNRFNGNQRYLPLIIQSLFSRADTGLLKEDSSPTMPNDVISKVMPIK